MVVAKRRLGLANAPAPRFAKPADSNCRQPTVLGGFAEFLEYQIGAGTPLMSELLVETGAKPAVTKTRFIDQGRRRTRGFGLQPG